MIFKQHKELAKMFGISDMIGDVKRMNKRQKCYQFLNIGMVVSSALMLWKGLVFASNCEAPIVVVLSGSMEPAFHRGDILFLTNFESDPIRVGDIAVFKIKGREIPIVHRVITVHEKQNGTTKLLTKGDNNRVNDRGLYARGQHWLTRSDVMGVVKGFVPYVGMATILMHDYPQLKYLFLVAMAVYCFLKRE